MNTGPSARVSPCVPCDVCTVLGVVIIYGGGHLVNTSTMGKCVAVLVPYPPNNPAWPSACVAALCCVGTREGRKTSLTRRKILHGMIGLWARALSGIYNDGQQKEGSYGWGRGGKRPDSFTFCGSSREDVPLFLPKPPESLVIECIS